MSVCVCVCVCLSPNVEPKPINRSCSKLIPGILSQISQASFFSFSPTPKIKGSSHEKKLKILIFSKMASTILIKLCRFIVHSKPNNMTLSAFPGKSLKLEKQFLILFPSTKIAHKPTCQSLSHSISRVPCKCLQLISHFRSTLIIKSSSHKKKNKKISFLKKWLQTIFIKFCGFIAHSNLNNMALSAFPGKNPCNQKKFFNFLSVA